MTNVIFKRTSVRKYTEQPVEQEKIEMLMKAGMAAPSAKNVQPWEFIIIKKRETLLKITEFHPYSAMLKEAPLAVVVCGDKSKIAVEGMELWPEDCAAATQNIMLQATEMNLGSVWLGVYPKEQIFKPLAELLKLPSNIVPFSIIAIGYAAGEVYPKDKFDSKKIHYENWGK